MPNPFSSFLELDQFLKEALYTPHVNNSFPPYNILNTKDGSIAKLQVAVAGYDHEDVKIELADGKLIIEGDKTKEAVDEEEWIVTHKGISSKKFSLRFNINNVYEIDSAIMSDGILEIKLIRIDSERKLIQIKTK